jgi:hypothetical protein
MRDPGGPLSEPRPGAGASQRLPQSASLGAAPIPPVLGAAGSH